MKIINKVQRVCQIYFGELCYEGVFLEDVLEVDVSAGFIGYQRGGVFVVGAVLDKQEFVDIQVFIYCIEILEKKMCDLKKLIK